MLTFGIGMQHGIKPSPRNMRMLVGTPSLLPLLSKSLRLDTAFYRQSLQIQHLHAELFHNATALRGINGPEDVQKMPIAQRELAIRSIQIARQGLEITVTSPAYREGMKYGGAIPYPCWQLLIYPLAVHYTHATATFAASFLLRLARLL
jgi:hypothetical protein